MASPNTVKLMDERAKMRAAAQLPPIQSGWGKGMSRRDARAANSKRSRKIEKNNREAWAMRLRRDKQIKDSAAKKVVRKPAV